MVVLPPRAQPVPPGTSVKATEALKRVPDPPAPPVMSEPAGPLPACAVVLVL